MPDEPEVIGPARPAAADRVAPAGAASTPTGRSSCCPIRTAAAWNRELIAEGQQLVRACLRRNAPGPFQVQAAISAVHSDATSGRRDGLASGAGAVRPAARPHADAGRRPQPRRRPRRGRRAGRSPWPPSTSSSSTTYLPFHVTRADLLRRLGRRDDAAAAYDRALELSTNEAERRFLAERHDG